MEGILKYQIVVVVEDDTESVQHLANKLAEGWTIDRADAMHHWIIYILRRYEETEREQRQSV
jgi:hypothetical protein